jgi:RimJ/RimL family protein N-acetyltransferase
VAGIAAGEIDAGHHPDNHASRHIVEKLGFTFLETVFYAPAGLLHPSYLLYQTKK